MPDRFRRAGEVWAWRLRAPREWRTESGDLLRGEAGDWWVVSPDGAFRSVSPAEFPKLYEQVSDQVYRRLGEVSARQVTEVEQLTSLEGEQTAQPGDWIVTDDRGNSWPVSDAVFRAGYRPA